jgi:hypothetical protein
MGKKKWIRPECVKINLVPEEAVFTGCKTAVGGSARVAGGQPCKNNSCNTTTS